MNAILTSGFGKVVIWDWKIDRTIEKGKKANTKVYEFKVKIV